MAQVWTRLGVYILTGLKSSVLILIFIQSCGIVDFEKNYDSKYYTYVSNTTNDELIYSADSLLFGRYFITLPDNSQISIGNPISLEKSSNDPKIKLIEGYLKDRNFKEISRNDTVLVRWDGPAAEMGDSVHHFFNYSSWEVIPYPEDSVVDGIIVFTITEDDLQ